MARHTSLTAVKVLSKANFHSVFLVLRHRLEYQNQLPKVRKPAPRISLLLVGA
jgi:hypothetical protein